MTTSAMGSPPRSSYARTAAWSAAAALWLAPWVAMQFTPEVRWSPADFVVFGVMLLTVGGGLELAFRRSRDRAWRAGVAVALATAFLLVWIHGAVGLVGAGVPAGGLAVLAVPAAGLLGALRARFRPPGMARAMLAAAAAQAALAGLAWATKSAPAAGLTAAMVLPWLVSARLFLAASRG